MISGRSDLVEISAIIERETAKAYLVDVGFEENIWLPKSQIEIDTARNTILVPKWLAKEKGLET